MLQMWPAVQHWSFATHDPVSGTQHFFSPIPPIVEQVRSADAQHSLLSMHTAPLLLQHLPLRATSGVLWHREECELEQDTSMSCISAQPTYDLQSMPHSTAPQQSLEAVQVESPGGMHPTQRLFEHKKIASSAGKHDVHTNRRTRQ